MPGKGFDKARCIPSWTRGKSDPFLHVILLTRRGGPVREKSNFPLNWPSSMSSSYLLQGPRVGRRDRSVGWRERGREGEKERGKEGESAWESENDSSALSGETMIFLLPKFPDHSLN